MKDLANVPFRLTGPLVLALYGSEGDGNFGAFELSSPDDGQRLLVIASSGEGWDHVSCSRSHRCPTWPEMEYVKRVFFLEEEVAMQLHLPVSKHLSYHPYTLHIWRPHDWSIILPPSEFV